MVCIIGFAGYESEDLVLYLGKIMLALDKRVAIIDRTEQEMMLEIFRHRLIPKRENEVKEIEYEGLIITSSAICYEDFDVVFLLFGYRLMHPKLYECDNLVLVTDGMPSHASLLQKIGKWERKQCIVVRNMVPVKHGEVYLTMLAGARDWECFVVPLSEEDIRANYSIGVDSQMKLRYLSSELKQCLAQLCCWLVPELDEKQIKRLLKVL